MSQNPNHVSKDDLINNMTKILVNVAENNGYQFSLSNKTLQPSFVFSYRAILPMFLLEAKENYEKIFNKKFSAQELLNTINLKKNVSDEPSSDVPSELVEKDKVSVSKIPNEVEFPLQFFSTTPEATLFEFEPRIEHLRDIHPNFNFGLMASCAIHSLEEYAKKYEENPSLKVNGSIPLEPFCQKWFKKLEEEKEYMPVYNAEAINAIDAKKTQKNTVNS